jgi:hypothetical protein
VITTASVGATTTRIATPPGHPRPHTSLMRSCAPPNPASRTLGPIRSGAGGLDAEPGRKASQNGVVGDTLEIGARHVRSFERGDLIVGQCDLQRGYGVAQVGWLGCAGLSHSLFWCVQDREIFDARVTLQVMDVADRGDEVVVTTKVDGNFDRAGLPDPVVIDHHIQANGDKIIELTCRLAGRASVRP